MSKVLDAMSWLVPFRLIAMILALLVVTVSLGAWFTKLVRPGLEHFSRLPTGADRRPGLNPRLGRSLPPDRLQTDLHRAGSRAGAPFVATVAASLLPLILIACQAAPPAAAAPTEIPSVTPQVALSATETPIKPLDTPTPVSTPTPAFTPTPTVSAEDAMLLRKLKQFGAEFWPGVEYNCDVRDFLGACFAYDKPANTRIFFEINFWNKDAKTIIVTTRNEDWVAGCEYPDFEHWDETYNWRYEATKCIDQRNDKGEAVSGLNNWISKNWPSIRR